MGTYVTHLECSLTGKRYPAGEPHGLSDAGRPLLVRYDLEAMAADLSKDTLAASPAPGFWRYADFLPVEDPTHRVSLGEVVTPILPLRSLGKPGRVLVKDEGRLPTGSFKARGLALAVSMAKSFGIEHLAIPTNGNAGAAMAAYARAAGMSATVLCPEDTPDINLREIAAQGAETWLVDGLINDCGKIVGGGKEAVGWFDVSTLKEPYRIEGKKTMGLELAEQMDWELPDVIFYPTGGGTGLIGMWKAFAELQAMGWIGEKLPRMVAVQATGCAPIVKAWEEGEEHAPLWENAHTVAAGIRVPIAVGDFLILRAVRDSGGFAMAVPDDEIVAMRDRIAAEEGVLLCPEGAATAVAYRRALSEGLVGKDDHALLWNCATGLKYPLPEVTRRLSKDAVDYGVFAS
ncbi:threonine synthase [Rhodobacterales bacterium HKCCE3408]|nr:threonine synthase [Rhodobacterales bacterium HKCCE3408]